MARSLAILFVATGCTTASSTSDDLPGSTGVGGLDGSGGAATGDAGTGGSVAADAAAPGDGVKEGGPIQADASIAESGTGTSEGGDAAASDAPDGGSGHGTAIIVWNGEGVSPACSSWANPAGTCSTAAQTSTSHSPPAAVEFTFDVPSDPAGNWLGGGWDWVNGQIGPYGTDITSMKNFTFWLKTEGQVAGLSFNLLCNGAPALDQPQHHTGKVVASTYSPQWDDGNWHQISVPLADLAPPAGFDPRHVAEFQFFNTGPGTGSFFFDDFGFDDGL